MVVALVVVVSHIKSVLVFWLFEGTAFNLYLLFESDWFTFGVFTRWEFAWVGALLFPDERSCSGAVLSFGDVETIYTTFFVVTIVDTVFNVDLSVGVSTERFSVAEVWSANVARMY